MGVHIRQVKSILQSYKATLHSNMKNMSVWAISTYPGNELGEAPCAWMQSVTPLRPTGDMMLYMGEIGAPSWIIDTDYETFAAGYACEEGPLGHIKNAAISTRDPTAPQEAVDKAFDAFARNGIEMNDWYPVVHTEDCVYDNDKERWCKDV